MCNVLGYKPLPSINRVMELFDYNPSTGTFIYKIRCGPRKAGSTAGSINSHGYILLGIDGKQYKAHRLAWLWMTGKDPGLIQIDHKDENKSNNKFENLRLATNKQNHDNISAHLGCSWCSKNRKWRARFTHNGKEIYLGSFDTKDEAIIASRLEREKLCGEFAPLTK